MNGSARQTAAGVLQKMEDRGAYSNLTLAQTLKKHPPADPRDAALVSLLVYGVTERKLTLDYNLSLYLKHPLKKLPPPVLQALRLGAYQLFYAEKIPQSAAVNESVKLVRAGGFAYAAGLVNAVLRKLATAGVRYPDESDRRHFLSVRYSMPQALVSHFTESYGEEKTTAILSAFQEKRPLFIQLNPMKCTAAALASALADAGASLRETDVKNACILENSGDVTRLQPFVDGWFYVQDLSSRLCVSLLGAKPGETVVDCCAAPGGKSFSAAVEMQNRGRVIACDLYEHKTALISAGAKRLGLSCVETVCGDARNLPDVLSQNGAPFFADRVLCDVPCSGLGVLGRKPEIRYKPVSELSSLPPLQYEILSACAAMVKPGGVLQYSTCTLNPAENEAVCDRFLAEHPAFCPATDEAYTRARGEEKHVTRFPSAMGGDGFFISKMVRMD